jgi:hypothetical protein
MFHLWCHVSAPKVSNIGVFCISDFQIKNAQLTGGITALKVITGLALIGGTYFTHKYWAFINIAKGGG